MVFPSLTEETILIKGSFDLGLVALSYFIAVFASYTALDLMARIKGRSDRTAKFLMGGCAICMGGGIWSMHFIGMLAFSLPMPVHYDTITTLFSLFIAILTSACAFYLVSSRRIFLSKIIFGGLILGCGIASMHYMGMAAMRIGATLHYQTGLFILSIVIAIFAATTALWLALKFRDDAKFDRFVFKLASGLIMGLAVAGMHYTGMAATFFVPSPEILTVSQSSWDTGVLAFAVSMATFFILSMTFLTTEFSLGVIVSVLSFLFLLTVGWKGLNVVEQAIKRNLSDQLQWSLKANLAALEILIDGELNLVKYWALEPRVRKNILSLSQKVSQGKLDKDSLLLTPELAELRKILGPFNKLNEHVGFVVIHPSGLQIASLFDEPIGEISLMKQSDLKEKALRGINMLVLPSLIEAKRSGSLEALRGKMPTLFSSATVYDNAGNAVAVLAFHVRLDRGFSQALETSRFELTAESYAFDSQGNMIFDSPFNSQLKQIGLIPNKPSSQATRRVQIRDPGGNMVKGFRPVLPIERQPLTRMVAAAVSGESGLDVEGYNDYRGVPVAGAWAWLPKYGFGIATEIDLTKALQPSHLLRKVFLAFLGILTISVVVNLVLRQRQTQAEKELRKAHQTLEIRVTERTQEYENSQRQLRQLCAHLNSVREEERTSIAREIHDELGQILTSLKLDLFWLTNEIHENGFSLKDKMKSMSKLIETGIRTVRTIATNLRPEVLDLYGLSKALENQAEEFQEHSQIKCIYEDNVENLSFEKDKEIAIYRIFQEIMTNAARYSCASEVKVTLKEDENNFYMVVRDNGCGIEKNAIVNPKSTGLLGMRERATQFGGSINFQSTHNKGTTIILQFPLGDRKHAKKN